MNSFLLLVTISLLVAVQVRTVLSPCFHHQPSPDELGWGQGGNVSFWDSQTLTTVTEVDGHQQETWDTEGPVCLGSHCS